MTDRKPPTELDALRQQNLLLAEENARLKEMLGLEAPRSPLVAATVVAQVSAITASFGSGLDESPRRPHDLPARMRISIELPRSRKRGLDAILAPMRLFSSSLSL
jgi:hypothetical protein